MENIRLPEDFTDRVMHRIEVRERAAARRTRAAAVAGGIPGGAAVIPPAVLTLLHSVLTTPTGPVPGIVLAVFLLALAGLLHDRRSSRHDISARVK